MQKSNRNYAGSRKFTEKLCRWLTEVGGWFLMFKILDKVTYGLNIKFKQIYC